MNYLHGLYEGIDVIIRFHDPRRFVELDRALFSLLHQRFRTVRPIIVTRDFSEEMFDKTRSFANRHSWEAAGKRIPKIVNAEHQEALGIDAHLLNVGIDEADSRYMGILDVDDYLYGRAYQVLVKDLERSQSAIAFGSILKKDVSVFDEFVYSRKKFDTHFKAQGLYDLTIGDFWPLHSFAIDRTRADPSQIKPREDLVFFDDYEFLLRLCANAQTSFTMADVLIGVYSSHVSRRIGTHIAESDETASWNRARRDVWRLKCRLRDKVRKHAER